MKREIELQFQSEEYRVLILADIQERAPLPRRQSAALRSLLDRAEPDLVILLGDMLFGPLTHRKEAVFSVIDGIDAVLTGWGVDYLVVSGNHDMDSLTSWKRQLEHYAQKPGCLSPGPEERECAEGYSAILRSRSGAPVCRFLLMDSGRTTFNRYGIDYLPPADESLRWERELLARDGLPVYVFQHVPVPEIYSLLRRVPQGDGAVRGKGPYRGAWFLPDPDLVTEGGLREPPCPSWFGKTQFEDWIDSGKVRGAFFGHDHTNDLVASLRGISLIYTSTAGLRCYGRDEVRGGRLLRFREDAAFRTEMLCYTREDLEGERK